MIKITFNSDSVRIKELLFEMKKNGFAYECPKGHYHIVYPIEEFQLLSFLEVKK